MCDVLLIGEETTTRAWFDPTVEVHLEKWDHLKTVDEVGSYLAGVKPKLILVGDALEKKRLAEINFRR